MAGDGRPSTRVVVDHRPAREPGRRGWGAAAARANRGGDCESVAIASDDERIFDS